MVVAEDFKVKARPWGSSIDDPRGVVLELFAALLGLWPEKVESGPTFAVDNRTSVVDVILAYLPKGRLLADGGSVITFGATVITAKFN